MFPDQGKEQTAKDQIQALRKQAWTEHFGGLPPGWQTPENSVCSAAMRTKGVVNWAMLTQAQRPDPSHLVAWPFEVGQDLSSFYVKTTVGSILEQFIVDAATPSSGIPDNGWMWASPLGGSLPGSLAE